MDVRDLVVEVRSRDLRRVGQVRPQDLNLKADLKDLEDGDTWSLDLPVGHHLAPYLREPGAGLVVSHRDPVVGTLFSGPVDDPEQNAGRDDPRGTYTFTGTTDTCLVWRRRAWPTPTAGPGAQGAYWTATGPAETVMAQVVTANLGPTTLPERRVAGLVVLNGGRGSTVSLSARYDPLGEVLVPIARLAGLSFRVVQVGTHLEFQVSEVRDRTGLVRLDLRNGTLQDFTATWSGWGVTYALVAGQGDLAARTIIARTTPAAVAAEAAGGPWARREAFVDSRNTDDPAELAQAGDELLLENAAIAGVKAVPSDDLTMRWPQDWGLGDTVGVNIGAQPTTARVESIALRAGRDGVKVGAGIGAVAGWDPQADQDRRQRALEARVARLERYQ